jgi:hypothetical protein
MLVSGAFSFSLHYSDLSWKTVWTGATLIRVNQTRRKIKNRKYTLVCSAKNCSVGLYLQVSTQTLSVFNLDTSSLGCSDINNMTGFTAKSCQMIFLKMIVN